MPVPESRLDVVRKFLGSADAESGGREMVALIRDDAGFSERAPLLHPEASILFPTPDGGFVGPMGGPFVGPEGYREAWREWLGAWRSFRVEIDSLDQVGEDRVLLLARAKAQGRSGYEVEAMVAGLYTVEQGKIVRIEHFLDQDQARRAAGLADAAG